MVNFVQMKICIGVKFEHQYNTMIYTHIPYAPKESDKNIGFAYNKFMEMLPNEGDWGCFLDHDAMFTTKSWYKQLNYIIKLHPRVKAFGARTNRVAYPWQLVGNMDIDNNDIEYHRKIGRHLQEKYYARLSVGSLRDHSGKYNPSRFSGVFILIQKKSWKDMGGFKSTGFLGVDDDFRRRLYDSNIPFAILDGMYVYHWYRHDSPYTTSKKTLDKVRKKYEDFTKKRKFDIKHITLLDETF